LLATIAFLPTLALGAAALTQEIPCPARPQPMPPAVEAIGEPPASSGVIVFAATPTEFPGRAWVVRLSRRGTAAALEIVRLRRRSDCNIYDVDGRWDRAVGPEDYRSVAEAIRPWATPPAGFPVNAGSADLALDGTGLELRVSANGWGVTRTLNHYGGTGGRLSAIFRSLVSRHVPAAELPAEDWRTRRP
jgi:hypothetical protein